jgi:kumamolisin
MASTAKAGSDTITIGLHLRRDLHDNGMTMQQYAHAVLAGSQPVLEHDDFVYQFGATDDDLELVSRWAEQQGLTVDLAHSGMAVVKISGLVSQFNDIFGTVLMDCSDDKDSWMEPQVPIIIPGTIAATVDLVLGLDTKPAAVRHGISVPLDHVYPTGTPLYSGAVTPPQVANGYGIPAGSGAGGVIGIFELTYSGYMTGYNASDVSSSFSRIGLSAPNIVNVSVDGSSISSTSDAESMLDLYCAGGVAPAATIIYYEAANTNAGVYDIINYAANDNVHNPEVLSISWGIGDSASYDTALQACVVKGITVVISSGDTGYLSVPQSSTSPYMVSAGGTNIGMSGNTRIGENAWSGSGGGISSGESLPTWQSGLYTTYVNNGVTGSPQPLTMRGIPDISAPADPVTGYQFYVNGGLVQYGGTSASAPWIAGAIVRMNRLAGKRIGLSQALWYSNPSAFYDITVGNNKNGGTSGYLCTVGWDAATGLGSINGPAFYALYSNAVLSTGTLYPQPGYGTRPSKGTLYPRSSTWNSH